MIAFSKRRERDGSLVKPVMEAPARQINMGKAERWISLAAGAALAVGGLARRSLGGLLAAIGGGYLIYRGQRGHCLMYQMLGREEVAEPPLEIREQTTALCSRDEAYQFCKDPGRLSCATSPKAELSLAGERRWRWSSKLFGFNISCEVELVEDRPGELLVWRTLPDDPGQVVAELHFLDAPSDRGTEIHLRMEMSPSGGLLGRMVASAGKPLLAARVREDLRRVKSMLETGEIATNAMRPARAAIPLPHLPYIPSRERKPIPAEIGMTANGVDPVEEASMESFPASDPRW